MRRRHLRQTLTTSPAHHLHPPASTSPSSQPRQLSTTSSITFTTTSFTSTSMATAAASRSDVAHSVLRRYLPALRKILTVATFVHLYKGTFTADSGFSWGACWAKGTMFVVETDDETAPYYLVLLNRSGASNFIWPVSAPELIEFDPDSAMQLLLRDSEDATTCTGCVISGDADQADAVLQEVHSVGTIVEACAKAAVERRTAAAAKASEGSGGSGVVVEAAVEKQEPVQNINEAPISEDLRRLLDSMRHQITDADR